MRVNARLDEAHARKLDELCRRTGHSRTDVLRAAIDRYYSEERQAKPGRNADILQRNGFVGCGQAGPDLATNYKRDLGRSLIDKTHGHR